jgi:hypothetical protein
MKRLIKTLHDTLAILSLMGFIALLAVFARGYGPGKGGPLGEVCYASPPGLYGQQWSYVWTGSAQLIFCRDVYLVEGPPTAMTRPGVHRLTDLNALGLMSQIQPGPGRAFAGGMRVFLVSQKKQRYQLSYFLMAAAILPLLKLVSWLNKTSRGNTLSMFDPSCHRPHPPQPKINRPDHANIVNTATHFN